jgi:hypothetical protein
MPQSSIIPSTYSAPVFERLAAAGMNSDAYPTIWTVFCQCRLDRVVRFAWDEYRSSFLLPPQGLIIDRCSLWCLTRGKPAKIRHSSKRHHSWSILQRRTNLMRTGTTAVEYEYVYFIGCWLLRNRRPWLNTICFISNRNVTAVFLAFFAIHVGYHL